MLRVDPDATIPGHLHPTVERCVVVRGRMVDGESFGPADYQGVQVGVLHSDIAARMDCCC